MLGAQIVAAGPIESQQLMDFRDSETLTWIGPEIPTDPTADQASH